MGEDRKFWSLITTIKAESTMILGEMEGTILNIVDT